MVKQINTWNWCFNALIKFIMPYKNADFPWNDQILKDVLMVEERKMLRLKEIVNVGQFWFVLKSWHWNVIVFSYMYERESM